MVIETNLAHIGNLALITAIITLNFCYHKYDDKNIKKNVDQIQVESLTY